MNEVAKFYKVSFEQFLDDMKKNTFFDECTPEEEIKTIWEGIKLPQRATSGSAGYDFYLPVSFCMNAGTSVTIPTGIRAEIEPGWYLQIVPRSSLGFKHGMRMLNTLPVIDEDYAYADNEGHIMIKITCEKNMSLGAGDRFVQGIFVPYGVTKDDNATAKRTGGIGSTGAK